MRGRAKLLLSHPFASAAVIRERLRELFHGLLEVHQGWTFADLRRLTLRQVTDILLWSRSEAQRFGPGVTASGEQTVMELPGPPSYEKEMADLEHVRQALGGMLSAESYREAREKIQAKYGKIPGR